MKKKKVLTAKEIRLDLACGSNKREGFTGVDVVKTDHADVVHDLLKFPWPFKEDSVSEVHCSHYFEHIPGLLRPKFMDELFRVMKKGATATFIIPYYSSMRAVQDFTHQWPPVCEASFLYFNKDWRAVNKLSHYDVSCDFDFTYGYTLGDSTFAARNDETRATAIKHYWNVVSDLQVILTRK